MAVEQLVLPRQCKKVVLNLAHTIPLAGHLGRHKTTRRVLQHFYWPTVHHDVAEYCKTCACQQVAGKRRMRAPLKLMLRKVSGKEGKDWDKLLPYLLFAYQEVPQASTGFTPFELLYGHCVWGPLSILSKSWQSSERSGESMVSHVLSMRDKLEKMMSMATSNLEKSQVQQKT